MTPTFAFCQLCRATKKLVKAHIIPLSLYRPTFNREGTALLISDDVDRPTSRSPSSKYDDSNLCLECEQRFAPWDDYATMLFIQRNFQDFPSAEDRLAEVASPYDYKQLKLFFISLLWRAGVSSRPFFDKSLGINALEESCNASPASRFPRRFGPS